MADQNRELLRPEDATSWEEFQARSIIEQAQCRGSNSSWKKIGQTLLSVIPGSGAILFWAAFAITHDGGQWLLLVFAVICTGVFAWLFGGVMRTGIHGTRRYYELDRLRKEWQARAQRGEIPETSPDGPKVWRDVDGTVEA
jgi:hypothetical protein